MVMSGKFIKILLPAVGGQGGGVLSEWIFQAFLNESYEVQGISLPGLSQRGGSTVYYIEAFDSSGRNDRVVFSQHPVPGDVDVIVAQEFLELGRILEKGYGSEKTTIISSIHRIYSTNEKLPVGSGIYSWHDLHSIAERFSSDFIGINALDVATNNRMGERAVNAILLGALCSSGCLPLAKESYISAIRTSGIAVEENIRAFKIGMFTQMGNGKWEKGGEGYFDSVMTEKYNISEKEAERLEGLAVSLEGNLPVHLHEYMKEAILRMADYQGIWYAEKYSSIIRRIEKKDRKYAGRDHLLTEIFLKNLALLMSYEDGIRVAELKIRESRFRKIREDMSIKGDQVFRVTDYLKPDAEEVYGLLPDIIVSPALKVIDAVSAVSSDSRSRRPFTLTLTPATSTIWGFLRLWGLAKLRIFRPWSFRYKKENSVIEKYVSSVEFFANRDYELACIVARAGGMIKGYGRVRRRTVDTFHRFIDNIICRMFDIEKERAAGFLITADTGRKAAELISGDEDGIVKAEELTDRTIKEKLM